MRNKAAAGPRSSSRSRPRRRRSPHCRRRQGGGFPQPGRGKWAQQQAQIDKARASRGAVEGSPRQDQPKSIARPNNRMTVTSCRRAVPR